MASIRNYTNANFNLMIKYLASKVVAQNIISYLGSLYILFVHKSSKIKFKDRKNETAFDIILFVLSLIILDGNTILGVPASNRVP